MSVSNILALFSGIALFLFGMTLMGDSLKKVAGNSLELILYKLSGSPLKGILLGAGVTAIIQSSSATSVMVVGFVNSGMMKVKQAISIIMGAIIGTSITGWIISLSSIESSASGILELVSTDSLTAIIAIIGIILRMFTKHTKQKNIGDIFLGFAVLMFGMKTMSGSVEGLRNSKVFIDLLTNFSNPFIGILVGAVFTAVIQSASAAVGILQALSSTGVITFAIALPILMGIAIGASVPVILSSFGAGNDGKRSAWSYLVIDIIGCIIVSIIYYGISAITKLSISNVVLNTFSIALVNSIFRVLMIVLIAPFINLVVKFMHVLIKGDEEDERWEEDKLEERFVNYPTIALEQVREVINQMAAITKENVNRATSILLKFDEKQFKKVNTKEEIIDKYADKLGTYLVRVTKKELNSEQNGHATKYLQALVDYERIGDHAVNIGEIAREIDEEKIEFSPEGKKEIKNIIAAIEEILDMTVEAFVMNDADLAHRIEAFEQVIDDLCDKMKANHIIRIRKGKCTIEHGIVFNDLLADFERISDHCENIAVEVLETVLNNHDSHVIKTEYHDNNKDEYNKIYQEYTEKYQI